MTREEADRLIGALRELLAAMARFSVETGLRRTNVTGLLWSQVNLARGTASPVLQELGGWQVLEMVLKYAHLASDHLAPYVDRMSGLRLVKDGEVATFSATGTK